MIKKVRISGLLHALLCHHTIMLSYYHAIIIAAPVMPLYYYNSCGPILLSCYRVIMLTTLAGDRMGLELGLEVSLGIELAEFMLSH